MTHADTCRLKDPLHLGALEVLECELQNQALFADSDCLAERHQLALGDGHHVLYGRHQGVWSGELRTRFCRAAPETVLVSLYRRLSGFDGLLRRINSAEAR